MPYSGKRKLPYQLKIYVPPEKERIVKNFIEAFRARNESASQKILSYIENYDNLITFDRGELEHILSLIRENPEKAIQMLEKKLSAAGRINPQTRLSQFDSEVTPTAMPALCEFGSSRNPCNKPAIAIAFHEKSGKSYRVCEHHMQMLYQEPEWRILTQGVHLED